MYQDSPVDYCVYMAVFSNIVHTPGVSIPRGHCYRRPICIYYFLGSTGTQRCRLPVDPRGSAATVTGRSQRARIRSEIFDFRIVQLYTLSNLGLWSLRLFLKIIYFYTYRGCQGYSNLQHTNLSRFLILLPCISYH